MRGGLVAEAASDVAVFAGSVGVCEFVALGEPGAESAFPETVGEGSSGSALGGGRVGRSGNASGTGDGGCSSGSVVGGGRVGRCGRSSVDRAGDFAVGACALAEPGVEKALSDFVGGGFSSSKRRLPMAAPG